MSPAAAVVLAGGAARRLGGVHKPGLEVGGVPIVLRVLRAVQAAGIAAVVVGEPYAVPAGIPVVREDQPGSGPVAAVAAGLQHLTSVDPQVDAVLLLAGDLPFLDAPAVQRLVAALEVEGVDLAVYLDAEGQPQWLCSAWRAGALQQRLADPDAPRGIRGLAAGLRRRELDDPEGLASTDVDTPGDLAAARLRSERGGRPDAAADRVGRAGEGGAGGRRAGR